MPTFHVVLIIQYHLTFLKFNISKKAKIGKYFLKCPKILHNETYFRCPILDPLFFPKDTLTKISIMIL